MSTFRTISFIIVLVTTVYTSFWFFLPLALFYLFMFDGLEILVLAVCIDALFGNSHSFPYLYTVTTSGIMIGMMIIKPHLRFYT